ncbi:hypothetical protein ACOSQ2_023128 [Xanthoceras sorbifolium]
MDLMGTWDQIECDEITPEEQGNITEAWKVDFTFRHIDSLLDNEWLHSVGFIPKGSLLSKRSKGCRGGLSMPRVKGRSGRLRRSLGGTCPGTIGELSPFLRSLSRFIIFRRRLARVISPSGELLHRGVPHQRRVCRSLHLWSSNPLKIPNTYGLGGSRPKVSTFTSGTAFTPKELVEFMCANAQNFMRSTEGLRPGKLSNNDRMRIAAFHTWMAFASLRSQDTRLLQAREHLKDLESILVHPKYLNTANQAKLEDALARGMIHRLKKELSDRAIDRWLKSEEFMDAVGVEYLRGARETKFFISKADLGFDLQKLEEVRAEYRPEEDFPEDSLNCVNIPDSDEEEGEVQIV